MESLTEILRIRFNKLLYPTKNHSMYTKLWCGQVVWLAFLNKTEIKNTGQFFASFEIRSDKINGYLMEILSEDLRQVRFVYSLQKND